MKCNRLIGAVVLAAAVGLLTLPANAAMYPDVVLDDNPLAYWRLDETAFGGAGDAADATLNHRDGTYTNTTAITLGQAGPRPDDGFYGFEGDNDAPNFAGSGSGRVELPSGFLPAGSSPRTFTGWFNGTSSTEQAFFNYGQNSTGNRVSITAGPNRVAAAVNGHNYGLDGLGLSAGWHHVAIVLPDVSSPKSNDWRFFVDGVERTSEAVSLAGSTQTINTLDNASRRIGVNVGGRIDEVAVYDTPFSAGQVHRQYSAALGREVFDFHQGADIPELGIANYSGLADVRMNVSYPDGDGGADSLYAGDSGNGAVNRSLIRFDVPLEPGYQAAGDSLLTLRVQAILGTVNGDDFFDLYLVNDSNAGFFEGNAGVTITASGLESSWGNFSQSPLRPWQDAAGSGDYPGLGDPGDGYGLVPLGTLNQTSYTVGEEVTLTVPESAMQQVIEAGSVSFLLRARDENGAGRLAFYDRRSGANGPHLYVTAVVPEPGSLVMLGLGGLCLLGGLFSLRRRGVSSNGGI